jgi:hypothetical protein
MRPTKPTLLLLAAGLLLASPAEGRQDSGNDLDLDALINAEDLSQRILIAPFTATTRDSVGLAGSLYEFLFSELMARGRHDLLELADCQAIEEVAASLYYAGCPPGDELGCQFVIGERSHIERVVSGRVTALEDGDFRVAVTVLDVAKAELALTYVLDLRAGEEDLLPRTVLLTLDNLMQQELDAPYEDAKERHQARMRAMEQARSEEEQRLLARMNINLRKGELEKLEADLADTQRRHLSQADLEALKKTEGGEAVWRELGITSKQYRSLTNSGLDFEKWRWRWAGHRMQLLGTVQIGIIGGATGLRYSGGYYLSPDLEREVDNFSWQTVSAGSSMNLGIGIGFGILRNLDIEVSAMWSRSKVYVRLLSGSTVFDPEATDPNLLIVDPLNRPGGEWSEQSVNLVGGEVMLRYYFLTVPKLRPSIGVGFSWITYPNLYNDPDIDDDVESPPPPIRGQFNTFRQVVDFGPQIEPGVQFDVNRWFGIFLRVPIMFAANPGRVETTRFIETNPIFSDEDALPDGKPPFGIIRAVIGVQGRLFGMPVKPKQNYDDMLEEDEEPNYEPDDEPGHEPTPEPDPSPAVEPQADPAATGEAEEIQIEDDEEEIQIEDDEEEIQIEDDEEEIQIEDDEAEDDGTDQQ